MTSVNSFFKGFAVPILLLIASCSKSNEETPTPEPANIWWYGKDTLSNAFTDVNTRHGYWISFFPPGSAALDHYVSLEFSETPLSGSSYQLTADSPAGSGKVRVLLETGVLPRYKSQTGGGSVSVGFSNGKFGFSAEHLHLLRDTAAATADALELGFQLKAY
jgi:hypothetical protein